MKIIGFEGLSLVRGSVQFSHIVDIPHFFQELTFVFSDSGLRFFMRI